MGGQIQEGRVIFQWSFMFTGTCVYAALCLAYVNFTTWKRNFIDYPCGTPHVWICVVCTTSRNRRATTHYPEANLAQFSRGRKHQDTILIGNPFEVMGPPMNVRGHHWFSIATTLCPLCLFLPLNFCSSASVTPVNTCSGNPALRSLLTSPTKFASVMWGLDLRSAGSRENVAMALFTVFDCAKSKGKKIFLDLGL